MAIYRSDYTHNFNCYRSSGAISPLFLIGDALAVLRALPSDCFDFCMTSPPYWGKREYDNGGIGLASTSPDCFALAV